MEGMKKYIVLAGLFLTGLYGCGDFLEEDSKENTYATTCADLNELLVGDGYMNHCVLEENWSFSVKSKTDAYFPWLQVMDDDVEEIVVGEYDESSSIYQLRSFYNWEGDPFNLDGTLYTDPTWGRLYKHIGVLNVILDKVEEFTDEPEATRNAVKGQAHFLRGAYYYLLVNLYAKPYDPVTAETDLGVPVKLTAPVVDENFVRDPVADVYEQVVADLEEAIRLLEGYQPKTKRRVTQTAAKLFLSRVYCYMGQWDKVPALCEEVLKDGNYALKDLTTTKDTSWIDINSSEVLFSQGSYSINRVFFGDYAGNRKGLSSYRISDELVGLFAENDARRDLFFKQVDAGTLSCYVPRKTTADPVEQEYQFVSDCFCLRLSEAYLNLAEASAMTDGGEGRAQSILAELMGKRMTDAEAVTATGEALVKAIREERRRELCFEGHRWFDLRRYAVSPKFPETKNIKHVSYDYSYGDNTTPGIEKGYYMLPAYPDGGWVMPIPSEEIEQTDGAIVNNEREDCLLNQN